MSELAAEVEKLTQELASFKTWDSEERCLLDAADGCSPVHVKLKQRQKFGGGLGKVADVAWSPDNRRVATATNDAMLVVYNGMSTTKDYCIFKEAWLMTCAWSPSGKQLATAGLDNACSIHNIPSMDDHDHDGGMDDKPVQTLSKHIGYVGSVAWFNDKEIFTASGDKTAVLWDVEQGKDLFVIKDHAGDVAAVEVLAGTNTFITGSSDTTAKLWDRRTPQCVCVLTLPNKKIVEPPGHGEDEGDEKDKKAEKPYPGINKVKFVPGGNQVVTAGEDGIMRLFDLRTNSQVAFYMDETNLEPCNAIDLSLSGRVMYTGHEDSTMNVWDLLTGAKLDSIVVDKIERTKITGLEVSKDGKAIAVGCRDENCYIFA